MSCSDNTSTKQRGFKGGVFLFVKNLAKWGIEAGKRGQFFKNMF